MITFSSNIQNEINSGKAKAFYLLAILNADGTVYRASTTNRWSVTMDDGIDYLADDYLFSVDPPQISSTVDREEHKVVLCDPDFLNGADAEQGLIGKTIQLILGFINSATGQPYTSMTDTFTVYKGKVGASGYQIQLQEIGESLFMLSGVSPLASVEMSKANVFNRDSVKARYPNDTCADDIFEGSGSIIVKWGKV